jgi:hypothetical protein
MIDSFLNQTHLLELIFILFFNENDLQVIDFQLPYQVMNQGEMQDENHCLGIDPGENRSFSSYSEIDS